MVWSNILIDVILVAIVCYGFIYGAKYGIIKVISKPLKLISSFVLAAVASIAISSNFIFPAIKEPVVNNISEHLVNSFAEKGEVPGFLRLMGVTAETLASGTETVVSDVVGPAILILSVIITFFVTYLFGKIVISMVLSVLNLIFSISILKQVSQILGALVGLLLFFVVATVIAKIVGICESIDLLGKIDFFSDFTGGFVFDFMEKVWSGFFGF